MKRNQNFAQVKSPGRSIRDAAADSVDAIIAMLPERLPSNKRPGRLKQLNKRNRIALTAQRTALTCS